VRNRKKIKMKNKNEKMKKDNLCGNEPVKKKRQTKLPTRKK